MSRCVRKLLGALALIVLVPALIGAQEPATVHVLLPAANAALTVQGQSTRQSGARRVFISPPLESGREFIYTLVAQWEPNNYTKITRTRTVDVRAGISITVDMRRTHPKAPDHIVVRYVPTPMKVVEAMLELAAVKPGDVVYDLGCGDGRIVVTAVERFGAKRGVGVDIDPARIKDSHETAKKANVDDRVEFRQEDVLKIKDYSDADVVMLYMGSELNLALRPVLQQSLRPGSRIVSHRFTMGDWAPEKTITLDHEGQKYLMHLWLVDEKKE